MAQEIADSKLIDTWSSSGLIVKPDISKIIEGWQLGEQPPHEYMNWLQNTFGSKLNHILKNGVASWNNETEYLAGATTQHNGNVWLCKTTNTNSEPTDANANWKRVANSSDVAISNILAELKNIDGSGSGLDADLLDGKHASDLIAEIIDAIDISGKLSNVVEDTTPQLGGALDCNGKTIDKSAVRQIADASIASGTHTFNYVSGDMQQLTATGAFGIVLGGFPTGQVSAFIIDAVNWGAYTVTHPANMLFAAGEAPPYTVSGTDRLLVVCDKDGVQTLHVVAQDIKTMVV